jgi:hypothetical protein
LSAAVPEFPAAGDGLDPARGLLDPLADPHAHSVPGVAGGAPSIAERCRGWWLPRTAGLGTSPYHTRPTPV